MRLSERMMLLDEPPEPLLDDMGVDLRRRDVGVAEELLHRAKIGATLEEMAGKGMTEDVRRDARGLEARGGRKRLEVLGDALLHRAKIGATLEEMAGKGMTEYVRRDARGLDASGDRKRFELLAETLA